MLKPEIKSFFDPGTWTFTYVVYEKPNTPCVVIDSVMNYDPKSGRIRSTSADEVIDFIQKNHLKLEWILETHAHADHLSAAPYIQHQLGGKIAIGHHIQEVQKVFKGIFNLEPEFKVDGSQFDYLIEEGKNLEFGNLSIHGML